MLIQIPKGEMPQMVMLHHELILEWKLIISCMMLSEWSDYNISSNHHRNQNATNGNVARNTLGLK